MDIKSFIKQAPKAELHSHIDGGLRVQTVLEIAKKNHVKLPTYQADELQKRLTISNDCKSLIEYFEPFNITLSVLQTQDALERAMFEYLEDASLDNTRYIEARFSPALHLEKGLNLKQVMDAIISGKKQAEKQFNIKSNIIVCGLRTIEESTNMELAQLAVDYKHKGVVAFDLAGAEFGNSGKKHIKSFEIAINNNLCRTVHAGEVDGAHSIAEALHYLGAQRIGHGTRLIEDNDLLNYVADRQIGLEICLTSNMQTKSIDHLKNHPIRHYFEKHIPVSINTDSTLISGTTLSKEYELAAHLFHFTKKELQHIMLNAFNQAFLPIDEKIDLIREVKQEFNSIA